MLLLLHSYKPASTTTTHHTQAQLAESLGSTEAMDKMLTDSLAIVAESKKRQQQQQAAAAAAAAAVAKAAQPPAPVYGPAARPVLLKANPRLLGKQPGRWVTHRLKVHMVKWSNGNDEEACHCLQNN